jgi:hypothetical protein
MMGNYRDAEQELEFLREMQTEAIGNQRARFHFITL